jgi:hypothetical protein
LYLTFARRSGWPRYVLDFHCLLDMALDSKAHFEQRLVELELHDLLPLFIGKGWTSAGSFAFSTTFVPGSADDAAFKRQVLEPLVGVAAVEGAQGPTRWPLRT